MTPQEFRQRVLQVFFQDVHRIERDNYDFRRFSFDGVDRSSVFDVGKHSMYLAWFMENYDGVYRTYSRFADDTSRDIYLDVLRFKLAGHLHVRIRSALAARAQEARTFQETFVAAPSTVRVSGMFGDLVHYDAEWKGTRYVVDTLRDGLLINLVYRQYYFERGTVEIAPCAGDFVVDGGACTGDTTAVFRGSVGPTGRIFAFDPLKVHYDLCKFNASRAGYENVTVFPYGLSDRCVDAPPVQTDGYNPGYRTGDSGTSVPLCRLDDLVIDGTIPKIDFIKLDIEGAELSALRGAVASLRKFRPRLAISIYHKPNDFFEICDFIDSLGLGYRFYLDHYTIYDEETVLYAIA